MNTNIFSKSNPLEKIQKRIEAHSYKGGEAHTESYTLKNYKPIMTFTDVYGDKEFKRVEFENKDTYDYFYALCCYKQYLYFLVEEGNEHRVFRYNMSDDTTEDVFTYTSENTITLSTVNDNYLVWKEDENANWCKVTMHCYDMNNKTDDTVYACPRGENGLMTSWNFEDLVLTDDYLYFDSTVGKTDGKADINLYRYSLTEHEVELVWESRGSQPLIYNGISWLSFDDERGEYIIRNLDENVSPIYMGDEYAELNSSENYIVGCRHGGKDGIMYYDGEHSIPIIETTGHFDSICCTDDFIMWDGWSHDYPMFYDIGQKRIVYTTVIEEDHQYKPYLSEDYLVFEANDYIPDPDADDGTTIARALIFYYIATDELK